MSRILIITQKVDKEDPVLGFFHGWIKEFSKSFSSIIAISLQTGKYDLPNNVKVLSLGKEVKQSRISYIKNFYKYIFQEKSNYDSVFVHMNQEYILFGGIFWKLMGKKVYMWRNHHAGNILTDIAISFCTKVFCTSKYSYTAKYKKTVLMPVGIDMEVFKPAQNIKRIPNSILFLSRMAPVKKPDVLIKSLSILKDRGINFTAEFYGDPLPKDREYYESLKNAVTNFGLSERINFYKGIPNSETPAVYSSCKIFVNLSSRGMYDKTIFESMACGCITLASNDNLKEELPENMILDADNEKDIADKIGYFLVNNPTYNLINLVKNKHSLTMLGGKLAKVINS